MVNRLKKKLSEGSVVVGTWAVIPSPVAADIIASAGLDFIIIDAEHGPITFERAQEMAIACEARKVTPIMRVADIDEAKILRALDAGMQGIQIPNVSKREHIDKIVEYSKYPPIGKRGFSPFTRSGGYSLKNISNITNRLNEETIIAINIEGEITGKNLDLILECNGVEVIFIGLYDLSKSLGVPGEVDNLRVVSILEQLVSKINNHGKVAGTIATNIDQVRQYKALGIRYIVFSVDCAMLHDSYFKVLNQIKG